MSCSVCDDYDIFNYMEIGVFSLILIFIVCLIVSEIIYMKKVVRLEKDVHDIKENLKFKNG